LRARKSSRRQDAQHHVKAAENDAYDVENLVKAEHIRLQRDEVDMKYKYRRPKKNCEPRKSDIFGAVAARG
jgi:hypothetical protein